MYLPKSDIFKDLRQEAIEEISEIALEEKHGRGTVLFSGGDPAKYFFILVDGTVLLTIGEQHPKEYVVHNFGETFGWSSVVGNDRYTAKAMCITPTTVLKIDKTDLERIFDVHERSGRKFYKSLARQLGPRLMDMHQ